MWFCEKCLLLALVLAICAGSVSTQSLYDSDRVHDWAKHVHLRRSLQKCDQTTALVPASPKLFQKFGGTLSLDSSGSRLVVGAYDSVRPPRNAGSAYIYEKRGNAWKLVQRLTSSDPEASNNDQGGYQAIPVALSGSGSTIMAAFTVRNLNYSPETRIDACLYRRRGDVWKVVKKFTVPASSPGPSSFAISVSLDDSGRTALLSSGDAEPDPILGAAYILEESKGVWNLSASLTSKKPDGRCGFGRQAMLDGSGTTLILTVLFDDANCSITKGSVIIFEKNSGTWKQAQQLDAPKSTNLNSGFGLAISIDQKGNTIAVSDSIGNIFTYKKTNDGFRLFDTIQFPRGSGDRRLLPPQALSFAKSGSMLAAGARNKCLNCGPSGAVIIFNRVKDKWKRSYRLEAPRDGSDRQSSFGSAIAVDKTGSTFAVGQPGSTNGDARESGRTYIFSN